MATPPDFSSGAVLTAAQMNSVGLWLVKSQTVGTGVASVSVTGAFSADYDNYRIIYTNGAASVNTSINLSLGATTTNYFNSTTYSLYATGAFGATANNGVSPAFVYAGSMDATQGVFLTVDLFSPFLSRPTGYGGSFIVTDVAGHTGGIQKSNTSFTGFTVTANAGTITGGTIRVYGYRK
jgi:hypothetical protein